MAKSKNKNFKQYVRKTIEHTISAARVDQNNDFVKELVILKTGEIGLRTRNLREHLIETYHIKKARANDIAVRAIKQWKKTNRKAA